MKKRVENFKFNLNYCLWLDKITTIYGWIKLRSQKREMKRLKWDRKTGLASVAAITSVIVLAVALSPKEITITENTTLAPVTWTFQRPSQNTIINHTLKSSYFQDQLHAMFQVWISHYIEGVSDQHDHLDIRLRINATVNNANGFVEKVHLWASKDQKSMIEWLNTECKIENLSLVVMKHGYPESMQAYVGLVGINHTQGVYASEEMCWIFLTSNLQSHQLEIACEIIYYNGTAYNMVVQPFQLNMIGGE